MNELIRVEKGEIVVEQSVIDAYRQVKEQIAANEAMKKEIEAKILEAMETAKITKCDNGAVSIAYVPAGDRETFDSKGFRADYPDLYDGYVKMTRTKASVRVTIR